MRSNQKSASGNGNTTIRKNAGTDSSTPTSTNAADHPPPLASAFVPSQSTRTKRTSAGTMGYPVGRNLRLPYDNRLERAIRMTRSVRRHLAQFAGGLRVERLRGIQGGLRLLGARGPRLRFLFQLRRYLDDLARL